MARGGDFAAQDPGWGVCVAGEGGGVGGVEHALQTPSGHSSWERDSRVQRTRGAGLFLSFLQSTGSF